MSNYLIGFRNGVILRCDLDINQFKKDMVETIKQNPSAKVHTMHHENSFFTITDIMFIVPDVVEIVSRGSDG